MCEVTWGWNWPSVLCQPVLIVCGGAQNKKSRKLSAALSVLWRDSGSSLIITLFLCCLTSLSYFYAETNIIHDNCDPDLSVSINSVLTSSSFLWCSVCQICLIRWWGRIICECCSAKKKLCLRTNTQFVSDNYIRHDIYFSFGPPDHCMRHLTRSNTDFYFPGHVWIPGCVSAYLVDLCLM